MVVMGDGDDRDGSAWRTPVLPSPVSGRRCRRAATTDEGTSGGAGLPSSALASRGAPSPIPWEKAVASPPRRVALHAARVGGGAEQAVADRARRRRDGPRTRPPPPRRRGRGGAVPPPWPPAGALSTTRRLGRDLAGPEGRGEVLGMPGRRVDGLLQVHPGMDVAQEELRDPLVLLVAARRAPGEVGLRRRAARAWATGWCAAGGRARGWTGRPSSSQNICARVPRPKPRLGMTGEDCSQPPEGVAATMLPWRSMTSKCTVSPRVVPSRPDRGLAGPRRPHRHPAFLSVARASTAAPKPSGWCRGAAPPRRASPISARRSAL